MKPERAESLRSGVSVSVTAVIVIVSAVAAGAAAARLIDPSIHGRYFPWITGRALGIAAYLSLTALVLIGTWMRHPWRYRLPFLHAETRLRAHAVLAVATVMLVVGHLVALAADRYAGVGWWGALIPGMSHYRRLPVALGVVAFLLLVLLTVTAGFAGRRGTAHWFLVHRGAALTFAIVWFHGLLAGTDAARLRLFYVVTGLACLLMIVTRYLAAPVAGRVVLPEDDDERELVPPIKQYEPGICYDAPSLRPQRDKVRK